MLPNSSIFRWQLYLVSNIKLSFFRMKMTIKSSLLTLACTFLISKDTFFPGRPWSLHREDTVHHWSQTWSHLLSQLLPSAAPHSAPLLFIPQSSSLPPRSLKIKGTHIQTYKVQDKSSLDPKSHLSVISETLFCVSFHTTWKKNSRTYFQVSSVLCYHRVSCSRLETCSVHRMLFSLGLAITPINILKKQQH